MQATNSISTFLSSPSSRSSASPATAPASARAATTRLAPTTTSTPLEARQDHDSPIETYLTATRRASRLAAGPYLVPLSHLRADVSRLHSTYASQAQDRGYPEFVRIWTEAHFALVHLGTPVPFGRDTWMNAWYALLLAHATDAGREGVVFAVYATVTLWRTQPGHLGARVAVPITPKGLEWLVERIEEIVQEAADAGQQQVADVVEVLKHAIHHNMFTLTAWTGGDQDHPIPTADTHRWLQGIAGDGWTRLLALTHHTSCTTASAPTSSPAGAPTPTRTGMAYVRDTLQRRARTPLVASAPLARLDAHAHRYAAHRDVFVQLGVLAPPAEAAAARQATGGDHRDAQRAVAPHATRLVGAVAHQIAGYHGERAACMRDAVDEIRRVGGRKRKEHEEGGALRVEADDDAGSRRGSDRPPGREFRPPEVGAGNRGGRPNDVTRWAMGRGEEGTQDGSRAVSLDDEDEMQVDS